jgi:hypothetical protein
MCKKTKFYGHKVAEKKERMGRVAVALGSVQHMTELREIRGETAAARGRVLGFPMGSEEN